MVQGQWLPGKQQASSSKLREPQAASFKPQATRFKLQATSCKLPDRGPLIKFYGARTEGLNADERIVRMAHMPPNLMGRKSYLVTLRNFKLNCKELIIFCVSQRIWHTRKWQILYTIPRYCRGCFLNFFVKFCLWTHRFFKVTLSCPWPTKLWIHNK